MILAAVPYTITGPAITNIFAPKPRIRPSLLNSSAGEDTALEKPVMGTRHPAPPYLAILSYIPNPVKSAAKNTKVMDTAAEAISFSRPKAL